MKTPTPPPPQQQPPLHSDQPSHQDSLLFFWLLVDPTFGAEVAMQGRQDRFLPSAVPVDFLRSADFFQFFWGLGEHQLGGTGRFFMTLYGGNP